MAKKKTKISQKSAKNTQIALFALLFVGVIAGGYFGGRALGFWAFVIDDSDPIPDPEIEDPPYIPGDPDGDPPHIPGDPIPEIIIDEDGNVIVIIPDSENETETTEVNLTNSLRTAIIRIVVSGIIVILLISAIVVSLNRNRIPKNKKRK